MGALEDVLKCDKRGNLCDICNLHEGVPCKLDRAAVEYAELRAAKAEAQKVIEPLTNRFIRTTFAEELDSAAAWMKEYGIKEPINPLGCGHSDFDYE